MKIPVKKHPSDVIATKRLDSHDRFEVVNSGQIRLELKRFP
jgi:hypothetical protein